MARSCIYICCTADAQQVGLPACQQNKFWCRCRVIDLQVVESGLASDEQNSAALNSGTMLHASLCCSSALPRMYCMVTFQLMYTGGHVDTVPCTEYRMMQGAAVVDTERRAASNMCTLHWLTHKIQLTIMLHVMICAALFCSAGGSHGAAAVGAGGSPAGDREDSQRAPRAHPARGLGGHRDLPLRHLHCRVRALIAASLCLVVELSS